MTVRLENPAALDTIPRGWKAETTGNREITMKKKNWIILGVVLTLSTFLVVAQERETREKLAGAGEPKLLATAEMQWGEGPPSLPAGAQMVVLDGDP